MSDFRDVLERGRREFPLGGLSIDGVVRARDRRRRNQRIRAGILALIIAIAATAYAGRVFESTTGRPAGLTPQNVDDLKIAWRADVRGVPAGSALNRIANPKVVHGFYPNPIVWAPAVFGNTVFVVSRAGLLSAYAASCGSANARCEPEWTASVGGAVSLPPTVVDGVVYVATRRGITAFRVACGATARPCRPLWTGSIPDQISSPPVVSGGLVYVFGRIPNEQLFAFRVGCATDGSRCSPVWSRQAGETWASTKWHHRISDEAVQFSPVVAGGVVYVIGITGQVYAFDARTGDRLWIGQTGTASIVGGDRFNQVAVSDGKVFVAAGTGLYAFPEGCATSGTECRPLWVGKSHENQFSEPVVVNGVVYVGSFVDSNTGEVAAFPADCHPHGGVCAPLWVDRSGEATSYYRQVAGNHVFATSGVTGFTDAFPVDCLQSCAPDWRATVFRPGRRATQLPLVSGDLVFTVNGAMLQAFDQNCATGGTTCPALWSWRSPDPSSVISTPTSVGAKLLVTTSAGRIYAFTPGGVSYVRDLQHRTVPCSMTFCGRM